MDWSSLAGTVAQLGGTALGTIFGGPLGGALGNMAGKMIAKELGVEPTPEAVIEKMEADPEAAKAAIAKAESWAEEQKAMYGFMAEQARQQGETHRAEIAAVGNLDPGFWRTTCLVMNTIWRPLYAIEGLFECMVFTCMIGGVLWNIFFNNQASDLDALTKVVAVLTPLLMMYMPARFAIIGYQMKLRTDEKKASMTMAAGGIDPTLLTGLVSALVPAVSKAIGRR